MERPDLSSEPMGVARSFTPAKGTLESQLSLTGEAATLDPMRGRFISENDPRAQEILAKQQEQIAKAKGKTKNWKVPGQRVFHKKRNEYGIIAKEPEGNRVEVLFPGGKRTLVQLSNLEKV